MSSLMTGASIFVAISFSPSFLSLSGILIYTIFVNCCQVFSTLICLTKQNSYVINCVERLSWKGEQMDYITLAEATKQLGVTRATLYYYMRKLSIEKQRFPLDKRVYLLMSDFERIKALKAGARERREQSQEETDPKLPAVA